MHSLLVFAHPEAQSFNGALKDAAMAALQDAGHTVELSDLYAMRFKAIADGDDFGARADPARLDYAAEQRAAHAEGTIAPDIAAEQAKLTRADLVIFQFPLWWYSVPAMLKGWLERVLSAGFAYGAGRLFDRAGLGGTRALLSFTTNGQESAYADDGWHGPIADTVTPLHQGLRFVGFQPLEPFIAWNVHRCAPAERSAMIEALKTRLLTIETETPIPYPPMAAYDQAGRLIR
jgi:NAD(P)H dehydrogenase (quinone)